LVWFRHYVYLFLGMFWLILLLNIVIYLYLTVDWKRVDSFLPTSWLTSFLLSPTLWVFGQIKGLVDASWVYNWEHFWFPLMANTLSWIAELGNSIWSWVTAGLSKIISDVLKSWRPW